MTMSLAAQSKSVDLTFIETSDIHGAIYPYNFITAKPAATSLAQVASLIKEERSTSDSEVVLLENGDSLQGQPTVYYYNFEKTSGPHIWSQAVNFLGYDAVGVGNHDIEAGHAVYDKLYEEMQAPVLCANAVNPDGTPYFQPYAVINKGGVKIAILGMITPKIPDWLPPQFWTGMQFEDMVQTAKKWVPIIQEKEHPDLLVGLFHSGVDYTYGKCDPRHTETMRNASQVVAEMVQALTLYSSATIIRDGPGQGWDRSTRKKSTSKTQAEKSSHLWTAQQRPQCGCRKMNLTWNDQTQSWDKMVRGASSTCQNISRSRFMAKFQPCFDEIKTWVDRPIGKMDGGHFHARFDVRRLRVRRSDSKNPARSSRDQSLGLSPADVSFAAPFRPTPRFRRVPTARCMCATCSTSMSTRISCTP
jgi:2',3'-cyclic-nucleotide 2'-phosphodiesterase/3'-nucleotidase